ncbi:unnamed protein product [Caenorhabditis angaria]|uniref:Uncharacterized protein n=1 Tax=Caenorhabditis angaria TaxID=860376 RepID=A0A9P1I2V5_9PELO|nr:unnamed protein product [Caenorhabditis angaria]
MLCYQEPINLRNVSQNVYRATEKEWLICPRCKNKMLKPNKMGTNNDGLIWIWWMCENNNECSFPMEMPPDIYHVEQTAEQAKKGFYPLPRIRSLPSKLHHLYPITFAASLHEKRCSSSASIQTSTCDSGLSNSSTEITSTPRQTENDPSCSTSEGVTNVEDRGYEIEQEEIIESSKKRRPIRTIKKEGLLDTDKSWTKLIAKIAQDKTEYREFLDIKDEQLISRVKEIIDEGEVEKKPVALTTKGRRKTFQLDEMDSSLRQYPLRVDWNVARVQLLQLDRYNKMNIGFAPNSEKVLDAIGIEVKPSILNTTSHEEVTRDRAKILSEKIEGALKRIHQPVCENANEKAKRQKLETVQRLQNVKEQRINAVRSLAKSRVLSRLSNSERPTPSITPYTYSNFASPFYEQITTPHPSPANFVPNEYSLNLSGLHDDYQHYQPILQQPAEVREEEEEEEEHQEDNDLDLDQFMFDNQDDFTGILEDEQIPEQDLEPEHPNFGDLEDFQF